MDKILFVGVPVLAYFAAHLFIRWDNKRIEAECKFTKRSDHTNRA